MGYGKANEVPSAVEKGFKDARKNLVRIPVIDGTIPHEVVGRYQATRVILAPAAPGSGLTASSPVRAVLEAAGVHNILTKCHRTANPKNLVKATMLGLLQLRTIEEAERLRGKKLARV
jgi:small subunit ribosomal protein S5